MNTPASLRLRLAASALFLALLAASSASAITLVNDSFADGARTNGADATDTDWYIRSANLPGNTTSSSGISVTPVTSANPGYTLVGYFSDYTVAVGQTITTSVTINAQAFNQLPTASRSQFRFGLFNSGTNSGDRFSADGSNTTINGSTTQGSFVNVNLKSTYTGAFGNGGTSTGGHTDTIFWDRAAGDATAGIFGAFATNQGGTLGYNTDPFSTLAGTNVTLSYSITNLDGTNALYDFKINGTTFTSISGTLTTAGTTYNTFGFQMLGDTASPFGSTLGTNQLFSNISVTAVPEPSTCAAFFGVAALTLGVVKRRRLTA